jgi:hypothetical protein
MTTDITAIKQRVAEGRQITLRGQNFLKDAKGIS